MGNLFHTDMALITISTVIKNVYAEILAVDKNQLSITFCLS
jgi:hypothetical protein